LDLQLGGRWTAAQVLVRNMSGYIETGKTPNRVCPVCGEPALRCAPGDRWICVANHTGPWSEPGVWKQMKDSWTAMERVEKVAFVVVVFVAPLIWWWLER
jgi:hypothetical protein